jgi:endoribonuclease Dicer
MERHEKPGGATEYSCSLQLPCNAPFEKLEGPVCSSMRLAQQVNLFGYSFMFCFY